MGTFMSPECDRPGPLVPGRTAEANRERDTGTSYVQAIDPRPPTRSTVAAADLANCNRRRQVNAGRASMVQRMNEQDARLARGALALVPMVAWVLWSCGPTAGAAPSGPANPAPLAGPAPAPSLVASSVTSSSVASPTAAPDPTVPPGAETIEGGLRAGYAAHISGRTADSARIFRELTTRLALPRKRTFELEDWSSQRASADGRYLLVETGRCVFASVAGSTSRHCGEVLVDVRARKIAAYFPVEPSTSQKRGASFIGPWLLSWKADGQRSLSTPLDLREVDAPPGEPLMLLPGALVLTATRDAKAAYEVRDVVSHRTLHRLEPRGPGPSNADGLMNRPDLRLLAKGRVLVSLLSQELVGFDLNSGKRIFSMATDSGNLWVRAAADDKTITLRRVCDWAVQRPPVPAAGCTAKAACPQSSVCPANQDATVDLVTGSTSWTTHDPKLDSVPGMEPAPEPALPPLGPLAPLFCMAGDELILPAEACATPR
jgi:hypothetical protein